MIGDGSQKLTDESKEIIVREGYFYTLRTGNLKYEKTADRIYSEQPEVKKKIEELQKKAKEKSDKDTTYYVRVDSKNKTVTMESSPTTKSPFYHFSNDVVKGPFKGVGNLEEARRLTWTGHPIKGALKGLEGTGNILGATTLGIGSFLGDFADRYTPGEVQYGTSEEVNRRQKTENLAVRLPIDILVSRAVNGLISKQFKMNKAGNTNREVATVENTSKGPEYMRKDSIFINDGTPGGTVKFESQVVGNSNYELSKITNTYNGNTVVKATNKVTGEIHSFKNFGNAQTGNSLSITNTNTSLVPFNPNVSTGVTVTTSSSVRTTIGSVGANLITSGKSVTTLEAPKNPVVKPVIKPEQNIETVKKPAITSEKPKTVERSHSQGSNNHNSNKESFNQKTEKNISSQNHHSGFTDEINSTAFTSNRNISASKISNNGVKLDVPKDLKPQITDIAKKGDLQGFKTEEVVNEILKRDPNVELLDSGKYGSNNGFDHVFRNKKTGEVWILDSKQIAKSGNMKVSNKGVGGTRQMSPDWVDNVLDKLDTKNQTRKAIESAINKGKINTGLVGVDKKTGELIFIPTRITNIKK